MSRVSEVVDSFVPLAPVRPATPWGARGADDDYGRPATPDWREMDWGQFVHQTEIGGRGVRYADLGEGEGPAVVFIHGLAGCWQNWLESLPRVAQERRVVAMDLPGFGSSEMPNHEVSMASYAGFVDALCDHLGLESVAVVGNSMGGFIGAEMAISFPGRVDRLALAAPAGISITNLRRQPMLTIARRATAVGTALAARSQTIVSRPRLRHLVMFTVVRHPTLLEADITFETLSGTGKPAFVPALDALTSYDFRDRLPEIGCPTLLLWGREDMLVPVGDADEFERMIPDVRKEIFDDTGHLPMIERAETFNQCVMEFLAERGEAGAPEPQEAAEPIASGSAG